ncbi:MAG: GNAT family N-acetyltransferase, partial [Thermomicrobiales bacterium]|nr:GNAT family N-acetyltransferase [Thermomicrobiales bacterium]
VHAGFGFADDRSQLDRAMGVICSAIVHPDYRRQGVGRELVRRAEQYLRVNGSARIQAGESRNCDPFYYGMYGGSRPSGFLESDALAALFFQGVGYRVKETIGVYQRDLTTKRDPISMRLQGLRRSTELVISDAPEEPTYWWYTHLGRSESLRFRLVNRKTQKPLAAVSVIGLDHYISVWNERAIGLVDIFVSEEHRGHGYCQMLLIESVRRVRQDLISRADLHVPDSRPDLTKAVEGAGFARLETGTVYERAE